MRVRRLPIVGAAALVVTGLVLVTGAVLMRPRAGASGDRPPGAAGPRSASAAPSPSPSLSPSPAVPPDSAIPQRASGQFTMLSGTGPVRGSGARRVTYRVEVEKGIAWGTLTPWSPAQFGTAIDHILAAPRGWTWSARHPVTNVDVHLSKASWSFQRSGAATYDVRIRLATPDTVDTLCGQAGLDTDGVHSCRIGKTILINLRRWLQGAEGYPVTIDQYRAGVINHEVGHFLGFAHMTCPGPGRLAPVMGLQTTELGGCKPNVYPFDEGGVFVSGPWKAS